MFPQKDVPDFGMSCLFYPLLFMQQHFVVKYFLSKTRHATQNSVYLILSLSQGSVAENIHRRTSTYHTFCLLRSLLPNTVISSDAISFSNSSYFLRLMRFPPLVDMYGNLQERLARAAPLQSKDSTVTHP